MTTLISKHPIPNRISPARRNLQSNAAKHQLKGKPSSEGRSSQISAGSDPSGASHRLHNLLIKSHLQNSLFHKTPVDRGSPPTPSAAYPIPLTRMNQPAPIHVSR